MQSKIATMQTAKGMRTFEYRTFGGKKVHVYDLNGPETLPPEKIKVVGNMTIDEVIDKDRLYHYEKREEARAAKEKERMLQHA